MLHQRLAALEALVLDLRQQRITSPAMSGGSTPQQPGGGLSHSAGYWKNHMSEAAQYVLHSCYTPTCQIMSAKSHGNRRNGGQCVWQLSQ